MTGKYNHSIDSKNRMALPAKLREELGDSVYLIKGTDECIAAYSSEHWVAFEQKLKSESGARARALQRAICASAARCVVDEQGRIVIPQELKAYAGLEKDATIVGVLDRAEFWHPDKWQAFDEGFTADDLAQPQAVSPLASLGSFMYYGLASNQITLASMTPNALCIWRAPSRMSPEKAA